MRIVAAELDGVFVIETTPFVDFRGYFDRSYCAAQFLAAGLNCEWAQENLSYTAKRGMVRGLHYQKPPAAEIKLIRCITGAVHDVVVDIRPESPTCGRWLAVELSESNHREIYVPQGFAHGFQCLTDDCRLLYHMSVAYAPELSAGIRWNDRGLCIAWPLDDAVVSARDSSLPLLSDLR